MSRSLAGLLVGRTLADRYEIEEMIGRGGMSLVYRARDRRLHRPVAVKVVSLPSESEPEHLLLRERLRREAAAAARVPPHPNVVQVYDYGTDEELDLDFIAMELLQGRDLKEILSRGPLPYEEAIRILREAARGLAAGHRAGIVHRDVKPGNVVVTTDDPHHPVKLLDFGIAKALEPAALDEELTRPGQAPHSPAYASPEQLQASEPITPASDVYQLGLVAHEMLSGQRAEGGAAGAGARWMAVPAPVRQVVEICLQRRPEERYPNAAAFAEALSRAIETEDGTILLPPEEVAVTESPADETSLFTPSAHTTTPPAATAEISRPGGARPAPLRGRGRQLAAGVIVILLAVLALRALGGRGGEAVSRDPEAPIAPDIEALDEEFRQLTEEAYRYLQERAEAGE